MLVTGGAGFIGSHVCEALLARGCAVTCLDNFSTGRWENIRHLDTLRVIEGDVNDPATFALLQPDYFDAVFHYAATVGVRRTEENQAAVLNDIHGLCHIAQLARDGKAKKIIFASSSEVYGEPRQLPEQEEEGMMGWSPYATVKLYGEYLYAALWHEAHIPTVSLRFFNVYGPRQRGSSYGFVTARFLEQVMAGRPPTVFGNGQQTRDFVYVADNVRAALAAMECATGNGQVINVGSGKETRIIDLAQAIIDHAGQTGVVTPVFMPGRKIEIARRCAATAKMRKLLQVSCDIPLSEGIRLMLAAETAVGAPAPVLVGAK